MLIAVGLYLQITYNVLVDDLELCKKIISTKKTTIVSLGMYDYSNGKPFSDENLCAIAHLGEFDTNPSLFCKCKSSTL